MIMRLTNNRLKLPTLSTSVGLTPPLFLLIRTFDLELRGSVTVGHVCVHLYHNLHLYISFVKSALLYICEAFQT